MHNQQQFDAKPRPLNALGNRPRGIPQRQRQEDTKVGEEKVQKQETPKTTPTPNG
jgi:hypothetical protein